MSRILYSNGKITYSSPWSPWSYEKALQFPISSPGFLTVPCTSVLVYSPNIAFLGENKRESSEVFRGVQNEAAWS